MCVDNMVWTNMASKQLNDFVRRVMAPPTNHCTAWFLVEFIRDLFNCIGFRPFYPRNKLNFAIQFQLNFENEKASIDCTFWTLEKVFDLLSEPRSDSNGFICHLALTDAQNVGVFHSTIHMDSSLTTNPQTHERTHTQMQTRSVETHTYAHMFVHTTNT